MIHAWVDSILKKNEIHGPNFLEKMNEINNKALNPISLTSVASMLNLVFSYFKKINRF